MGLEAGREAVLASDSFLAAGNFVAGSGANRRPELASHRAVRSFERTGSFTGQQDARYRDGIPPSLSLLGLRTPLSP